MTQTRNWAITAFRQMHFIANGKRVYTGCWECTGQVEYDDTLQLADEFNIPRGVMVASLRRLPRAKRPEYVPHVAFITSAELREDGWFDYEFVGRPKRERK